MMDQDRTLQITGIKTVFSQLTKKQKYVLIEDLMKLAEVDSIINVNHSPGSPKLETNLSPEERELRQYRENFTGWMMPFFCKSLKILDDHFLQQCFETYLLLEEKSLGGRHISISSEGDCYLYASLKGYEEQYEKDKFKSVERKTHMFKGTGGRQCMFEDVDPGKIQIFRIISDKYAIRIKFTRLLKALSNDPDQAKIILHILGYLGDECKDLFLQYFPQILSVENIGLTDENVNLVIERIPRLQAGRNAP